MKEVKNISVLGANGNMGINLCGLFASFGNSKVYVICKTIEKSKIAIQKAILSVKSDSIKENFVACDYSDLSNSIGNSDLVFESVTENIEIKKSINKKICTYLKNDAIFCTGTSCLSINELASEFEDDIKSRYIGIHFFNPPYNMQLCEIIPSKYNSPQFILKCKQYLVSILNRKIIVSNDTPGFIANRIGFELINTSMIYAEKYASEGGINYIDYLIGGFTGRAIPPLKTADFVGLDVHKAIVDNIYNNTYDWEHKNFKLPGYVENLIFDKKLGFKSKKGLYMIDDNKIYVYDILAKNYMIYKNYNFDSISVIKNKIAYGDYKKAFFVLFDNISKECNIIKEILVKNLIYSLFISDNYGENLYDCDTAMAYGFNWCPPLAMIDLIGKDVIYKECKKQELDKEIDVKQLLQMYKPSSLDYRRYLRGK